MKPQLLQHTARSLALPFVFAAVLAGCDSESLLVVGPLDSAVAEDGTVVEADIDSADAANGTTIGDASSVAVDSVVLSDPAAGPDASGGVVAASLIADSTAAGPVKIMAVGDSITQGISGASSYRREFTGLMETASCSFTMVGSQQTLSLIHI